MTASSIKYEKLTDAMGAILNSKFLTQFRTGYFLANGVIVPEYYKEFGDQIKSLNVRQDDVWICSFPKCGTTWTQEMVWLIGNDLDYEGAKTPLPVRFPFLEHTPLFDYREISRKNPDFHVPKYVSASVDHIDTMPSTRFIKTHLPYSLLPDQICNNSEYPKIIYTYRNAKDCLTSYYHHCRLLEGYQGNFDEFYKLFLGGRVSYAPFWSHVLGFWEKEHQKNILILSYEEMKKDLPSVIRRTADFLGKSLSDQQINVLTKHLSFESMKNNPAVNYEPVIEMNKKFGLIKADGCFMRTGQVGSFKGLMTKEQIENIDRWSKESVKGSGFQINDN